MLRALVFLAGLIGFLATSGAVAAASSQESKVVDISRVDQLPIAVYQVSPKYPPEMKAEGIEGKVIVELIIDTKGLPRDCKVVKSTRSEFEASAIAALSQWKFEPGMKGGRAVNTHLEVPIVYALKSKKKKN